MGKFTFIRILLALPVLTCAMAGEVRYEAIQDTDVEFLLENPKLPWGPDPFRKMAGLTVAKPSPEKFGLQGIAYRSDRAIAIVDGQAVSVGDILRGRKVIEIGSYYIVLEKGESQIEILMPTSKGQEP